jgi:hypothetical protein
MREAAQRAQELRRQAEAARSALNEAAAKVQELEQQATAAQKTITLFQEQESVIARAFQDAQRTSDEMLRAAKARSEEVLAGAKSAGEAITASARTAAAETLQKARESAQAQLQSAERTAAAAKATAEETAQAARATAADTLQKARESAQAQLQSAERTAAAAKAAAEEIVQAARDTAADTLLKARESAQEQLQAAERAAAEHVTRMRAESDQLVAESNRKIQEVQQAAEQYLSGVTAKLDAFARDREAMSRGLDALARNHAESLQTMTRLRSEVQSQILPAVHRLLRKLKGEEVSEADDAAVPSAGPAEPTPAVAPQATFEEAAAPAEEPKESLVPAVRHTGEIIVSPIHSFLQATKFMTALSQIKPVVSVKLRTYSGAKALIEVVTEGQPVGSINCKAIGGFPVEVVESNDTQIVLRIGSPTARPVPG